MHSVLELIARPQNVQQPPPHICVSLYPSFPVLTSISLSLNPILSNLSLAVSACPCIEILVRAVVKQNS